MTNKTKQNPTETAGKSIFFYEANECHKETPLNQIKAVALKALCILEKKEIKKKKKNTI